MPRRKTVIDSVITMMSEGYDPSLITEDPVGMTNDYSGGEDVDAAMMIMPGDESYEENDMDMDRCEEERGFAAEDYAGARELVRRVGSIERVRELLANLENVQDTLDLEPSSAFDIDGIAGQMPDDPDLPTSHHDVLSISALYDPGQSGQM